MCQGAIRQKAHLGTEWSRKAWSYALNWFVRNGQDLIRQKELHETKTQTGTEEGPSWDLQQPSAGRRAYSSHRKAGKIGLKRQCWRVLKKVLDGRRNHCAIKLFMNNPENASLRHRHVKVY